MADEEEIEIEGTEEIVPDEIGPDDLADVEGEIDPEDRSALAELSGLSAGMKPMP